VGGSGNSSGGAAAKKPKYDSTGSRQVVAPEVGEVVVVDGNRCAIEAVAA